MTGGEAFPAKVSFVCHWSGEVEATEISNADAGFAGKYFRNKATLSWSAQNEDGFSFVSDPFSGGFAVTGTTRNGQFFK